MPAPETPNGLPSADRPLEDPGLDRLGYAPFAKHLAEAISKMSPQEGFVIALYGPWGSGKSTALNFVEAHLRELPNEQQPLIVRFNPWWFSGHGDVVGQLLGLIQNKLGCQARIERKIKGAFSDLATLAGAVPGWGGAGKLPELLSRGGGVPQLKDAIGKAILKRGRRLLVVVDDIDRLEAEEVRQVFRAIKAVGDFPNVVYLLAFDSDVAVAALEQLHGVSGQDYLEKIVQVPFELPLPEKTLVDALLIEKLNLVLQSAPSELFDQTHWANTYLDGMGHFVRTPRDAVRLANTVAATYPAVAGEVNPVDFIAVEALRVFCPDMYDIVRNNPTAFAGSTHDVHFDRDRDRKTMEGWLSAVPDAADRDAVKRILTRLFPRLEALWRNSLYGEESEPGWRRGLRACSPDHISTYFRLAVPTGAVTRAEMMAILAVGEDPVAFGGRLVALAGERRADGTSRADAFLERVQDYTQDRDTIPDAAIGQVIRALLDVGDKLSVARTAGPQVSFMSAFRIPRVVHQLLSRKGEGDRFAILRQAVADGRALSVMADLVDMLLPQPGANSQGLAGPDGELLVSPDHARRLQTVVLSKIRAAAKGESLISSPHLPRLLYLWRQWGGDRAARNWAKRVTACDEGLVRFIAHFLQMGTQGSVGDVVARPYYSMDVGGLRSLIDVDCAARRLRQMVAKQTAPSDEGLAVETFLREYDRMQRHEAKAAAGGLSQEGE